MRDRINMIRINKGLLLLYALNWEASFFFLAGGKGGGSDKAE